MTHETILSFKTLAPLLLPDLLDLNHLESIDDYDDYALLAFNLARPTHIEDILDALEDQMELSILYHAILGIAAPREQDTAQLEKGNKGEQGIQDLQRKSESKGENGQKGVYDEYGEKGEKWKKGGNDEPGEKGGNGDNQNNQPGVKTSYHACAYSNPGFGHMYKVNVQTDHQGMADSLYIFLFESLEVMLEALKDDLECHQSQEGARFISKMEMGRFVADFM